LIAINDQDGKLLDDLVKMLRGHAKRPFKLASDIRSPTHPIRIGRGRA
jgi:hypothetical protein